MDPSPPLVTNTGAGAADDDGPALDGADELAAALAAATEALEEEPFRLKTTPRTIPTMADRNSMNESRTSIKHRTHQESPQQLQ